MFEDADDVSPVHRSKIPLDIVFQALEGHVRETFERPAIHLAERRNIGRDSDICVQAVNDFDAFLRYIERRCELISQRTR